MQSWPLGAALGRLVPGGSWRPGRCPPAAPGKAAHSPQRAGGWSGWVFFSLCSQQTPGPAPCPRPVCMGWGWGQIGMGSCSPVSLGWQLGPVDGE